MVQRVSRARVSIGDRVTGEIGHGLLLLVGFRRTDGETAITWMADKVRGLRIFNDEQGRMNCSVEDVEGSLLVVSQFTLYGDASRGRRPSFIDAAEPATARPLYNRFIDDLRGSSLRVETGEFGAMMEVELVNDGPVTIVIDRE